MPTAAVRRGESAKRVLGVLCQTEEPSREHWGIASSVPRIRQIYGHFLAPRLLETVKTGLVAKDFNFPSAYHAATGRSLEDVLHDIEALSLATVVRIADGVHIRGEAQGDVVYTPHYNGYFVNTMGQRILDCADESTDLLDLARQSNLNLQEVIGFISELLVLGIVDVEHAPVPV